MRFDYQRDSGAEDYQPLGMEESPVSGVHVFQSMDLGNRLPERDLDPQNDVEVYVSDFPVEDEREDAKSPTQSWIAGFFQNLKARISQPPAVPEVKEFIPMDEQQLADMVAIEEGSLEVFRRIVENRELLELNALAAGMSLDAIRSTDDYRLDPNLTGIWRRRVEDKQQLIAGLKKKLEIKRMERRLRNGIVPAYQRLPRI